jgi:hypothetical protein
LGEGDEGEGAVSQQALMELAKEAIADFNALVRIQALPDEELRRRGLDKDEIGAVRDGFFERLALAGSFDDEGFRASGCCGG